MNILVLVLILLLLFGGGGYYGHGAGWNMQAYGLGSIGTLIVLLIVLKIFGII